MTMVDGKCDVCNKNPPVGVASSPFAAYSMAYCVECLEKPAESRAVFAYLYEDVANYKLAGLNEYVFGYYTYEDGEYIQFKDWVKKHYKEGEHGSVEPNKNAPN